MKSTKQKQEATIQDMNNDFAQTMARKEEDHAAATSQLTAAHQAEMDAVNQSMSTLKAELEELRNQLAASEKMVADLEQ